MTYDEAVAVLSQHSEHGIKDAELLPAISAFLGVVNDRFAPDPDGEFRGGTDAADALQEALDRWDVFVNEASFTFPAGESDAE